MESDGHSGRDDERPDDNVVRFPKDWFGPIEDLVPVGSRARAREAGLDDEPAATPAGADDFWGEGSAAMQEAVAAPRAPASRSPGASAGFAGSAIDASERDARGATAPMHSPRRSRHVARRPRRIAVVATASIVAVAAMIAVLVSAGGGGHRPAAAKRPVTAGTAYPSLLTHAAAAITHDVVDAESAAALRAGVDRASRLELASTRAVTRGRTAHRPRPSTTPATPVTERVADPTPAAAATTTAAPVEQAAPSSSAAAAQSATPAGTAAPASSGDTQTTASTGGSSGSHSGSSPKTYGYGGLLGAGHAGN